MGDLDDLRNQALASLKRSRANLDEARTLGKVPAGDLARDEAELQETQAVVEQYHRTRNLVELRRLTADLQRGA